MDEKDFKKHLRDLVHGHHHPEEHDWANGRTAGQGGAARKTGNAKKRARKPGGRAK